MKASWILKNAGKVIVRVYPSFDSYFGPNPTAPPSLLAQGKCYQPVGYSCEGLLSIRVKTDTVKFCATKK